MTRRKPRHRIPVTVDEEKIAQRCAKGRIVLIDDDTHILGSLRALMDLCGYFTECHASAEAFLAARERSEPSWPGPVCVVSDVRMGDLDGIELLRRVRDEVPLVLMSGHSGAREVVEAFRLGVVDFLVKPFEAEAMLAAVAKSLEVDANNRAARELDAQTRLKVSRLTPREQTVAVAVARGHTNREIAVDLGISERMVKMHRHQAFAKLDVANLADFVRVLDRAGLTRET